MHRIAAAGVALGVTLAAAATVEARITSLVITTMESPAFAGRSFGDVGPYEKLVGRATGEVDPADPRNTVIADLELAPRNQRGLVEYATDVYILRPVNRGRGNHSILFDINNRGNHGALLQLNDAPASNDPVAAGDAGNGFLMRLGYTVVLSGWDVTVPAGDRRLTISVPAAVNADGSEVVGPSLDEFVIDRGGVMTATLSYPAASLDTTKATLTNRARYADVPRPLRADSWEFVDDRHIRLVPKGAIFHRGTLYELTYQAKGSPVAGLAFAALRDLTEHLRYARVDDSGRANPLANDIERVLTFSISQPSRFLHDFVHLGFNSDSRGRKVFDGLLLWLGGASGGFFNYRFAQPGRTHRQHIGRWFPEFQFPFAWSVTTDPVTATTDGRLARCARDHTCPYVFDVNSENEYWAKASSLLHTNSRGTYDLPDPPNVRHYLLSSLPHTRGPGPTGRGICHMPRSPLVANATLRALLINLHAWVASDHAPPPSRVPRIADGTLVPPLPQSRAGFPYIPGVVYNGRLHEGDLLDFGPDAKRGILSRLPPRLVGSPYAALVPRNDDDGHNVAGIRTVDIEVPLATYTGWGLRAGFAAGEGCDAAGQHIALPATEAERAASGDPRASLEERYPTHADYVKMVNDAAVRLEKERFLLAEDRIQLIERAQRSEIGRPKEAR